MSYIDSLREKIRSYILENYLYTEDQSALIDTVSFLDSGILDSMGVLEIVSFIENDFGIKVEEKEVVPENFDSVNQLVAYIERKLNIVG